MKSGGCLKCIIRDLYWRDTATKRRPVFFSSCKSGSVTETFVNNCLMLQSVILQRNLWQSSHLSKFAKVTEVNDLCKKKGKKMSWSLLLCFCLRYFISHKSLMIAIFSPQEKKGNIYLCRFKKNRLINSRLILHLRFRRLRRSEASKFCARHLSVVPSHSHGNTFVDPQAGHGHQAYIGYFGLKAWATFGKMLTYLKVALELSIA